MKKLIKRWLLKAGYVLMKTEIAQEDGYAAGKLLRLIEEVEAFYRLFIFKNFPDHDKQRMDLLSRLSGTTISEAMYLIHYLHESMNVGGDVCEFGVAQGRTSALLAYEILSSDKKLWLFDSFQGLPKPSIQDKLTDDIFNLGEMRRYEGTMAFDMRMVRDELARVSFPSSRVSIVPGFVEKTLVSGNHPNQICFAYLDLDLYEPILTALNFLDHHVQKNGYIIVDDYGFFSSGVKTAVDEFLAANAGNYHCFLPDKSVWKKFCIIKKL